MMVKPKLLFDKNDSCTIKKGLVDLELDGSFTLNKLQHLMESDTKYLNLKNYQNEDHILGGQFKCLEAEISALQIFLMYRQKNEKDKFGLQSVSEKTLTAHSDHNLLQGNKAAGDLEAVTLCSSIEKKYVFSLKSLVTETVEDSLKVAACDLWEEELTDWQALVADFDQYLDTQTWEEMDVMKASQGSPYTILVSNPLNPDKVDSLNERAGLSENLSAEHRLIINTLSHRERLALRGEDGLLELMRLSCSAVAMSRDLADACMEIWEIIMTMCGKKMKTCLDEDLENDINVLRQVLYNTIRCLQNICRKQMLRQLRISSVDFTQGEFLGKLKAFCSSDHSTTQKTGLSYYLTLIYWCFRCGCPDALRIVIESLETQFSDTSQLYPDDIECLNMLGSLLIQRLLDHSHSAFAEEDMIWNSSSQASLEISKSASNPHKSLDQLLDRVQQKSEMASHPIFMLFMSLVQPDGTFVGLKTIMPNATAEDFLWYNLTLLEDKPTDRLIKGLFNLQKRIVSLGPGYFGSGVTDPRAPLAFAKVACLVMAPTVAIDWASQAYSELTVIALQWLFYLSQCGFVGSVQSHAFLPTLFPDLERFLGTTSLSSGFEELLLPNGKLSVMSLSAALQWCELLPAPERITVISSLTHAGTTELLESPEQRSYILGRVNPDGSCLAGLLYRCLLAHSDIKDYSYENYSSDRLLWKENCIAAFETLVAGVAEAAAQCQQYLQAVELSYLISQDRTAMKFLLQHFTSASVFPHFRLNESTRLDTASQKAAFMFFQIFKDQYQGGRLSELESTFELLIYAKAAAECYCLAYEERWEECWEQLNQPIHSLSILQNQQELNRDENVISLFPDSRLMLLWNRTDLAPHLPRLVDVASLCVEHLRLDDKRFRARVLLKTCQELLDLTLNVSQNTLQRLKKIIELDHS